MDNGATNSGPTAHAIVLQRRYTVTVSIPALSARHCF